MRSAGRCRDAAAPDDCEHPEGAAYTPTEDIVPHETADDAAPGVGCGLTDLHAGGMGHGRLHLQKGAGGPTGTEKKFQLTWAPDGAPGGGSAHEAAGGIRSGAAAQRLVAEVDAKPRLLTPSAQTGWMSAAACVRSWTGSRVHITRPDRSRQPSPPLGTRFHHCGAGFGAGIRVGSVPSPHVTVVHSLPSCPRERCRSRARQRHDGLGDTTAGLVPATPGGACRGGTTAGPITCGSAR